MLNKEGYISIIVPIYNVENFLKECINSILEQTYRNFELLLINDGSTDSSGKIIDEYVKKDKRIIVIHTENGGISAARYKGLQESVGEFVCFVDSDDFLHPQSLELMVKSLYKENADLVFSNYLEFSSCDIIEKNHKHIACDICNLYKNYGQVIEYMPIMPWGKLYKRELFEKLNFAQFQKDIPKLFLEVFPR